MSAHPRHQIPDFPRDRPTVPEVLPLVRAIYASDYGGAGCCLHVVLDDGNIEADMLRWCLADISARPYDRCEDPTRCRAVAEAMLRMTPTQRRKLVRMAYVPRNSPPTPADR